MKQRALNIIIALDQLAWVLLTLGHSSPDETMSAGIWRMEQRGKWQGRVFRPMVDLVFWFDQDHCRVAYEAEIQRRQLPREYR